MATAEADPAVVTCVAISYAEYPADLPKISGTCAMISGDAFHSKVLRLGARMLCAQVGTERQRCSKQQELRM